MYERKSLKYNKVIKIIHPGEFYVSNNDEIIGTLLGSCVAVCLFDLGKGISGMNHYMLPGKIYEVDVLSDRSARYGITAIHELINKTKKFGATKSQLIAKIFGGGHVLESENSNISIPFDNIRLAKLLLEMEDIPIQEVDVGENYTRKLLMDVKTGKVFLKKTTRSSVYKEIENRDKKYLDTRFNGDGKSKGLNY